MPVKFGMGFHWVPPKDLSLPVLKELPEGVFEGNALSLNFKAADDGRFARKHFHCHFCDGWIPGEPEWREVNDLGILCGRRGTEYYCIRCGNQIAFSGVMA